MRTKLPCVDLDQSRSDSEIQDIAIHGKDSQSKETTKFYADKQRHAKPSDIQPGDVVLLKQRKANKLSPRFSPSPFSVVKVCGNSVQIKGRKGKVFKRNITHVKKCNSDLFNACDLILDIQDYESEG